MREIVWLAWSWHCLVMSNCDTYRDFETSIRNYNKVINFEAHHCYTIKPMNTCDTVVQVHSVLQCAKIQHCTHTHGTHFGRTMGKPVPMQNPNHTQYMVTG